MLDWFCANPRDLPWRRTRDPYAIWVSEIMLQQTQVKTVIPYWERWMRELPTVESVAKASPAKLHKLWEGLGYYTRVRNMQKAAQQIVSSSRRRRRRGNESPSQIGNRQSPIGNSETPHVVSYEFPVDFNEILALPGVGRYTAGAIASIAFNQPLPTVDGNVIRVLTRLFGIRNDPREKKTNERIWELAEELVSRASILPLLASRTISRTRTRTKDENAIYRPSAIYHWNPLRNGMCVAGNCSAFNQSLMEFGAVICTPRSPRCDACPVKTLCIARQRGWQERLPSTGKADVITDRRFVAFIVERDGKFLVRQRPAGVVNAHLWEFPNAEISSSPRSRGRQSARTSLTEIQRRLTSAATTVENVALTAAKPLCTIKHSITRYRITVEAWHATLGGRSAATPQISGPRRAPPSEIGVWRTPAQIRKLAFTAAHKKLASVAIKSILPGR